MPATVSPPPFWIPGHGQSGHPVALFRQNGGGGDRTIGQAQIYTVEGVMAQGHMMEDVVVEDMLWGMGVESHPRGTL